MHRLYKNHLLSLHWATAHDKYYRTYLIIKSIGEKVNLDITRYIEQGGVTLLSFLYPGVTPGSSIIWTATTDNVFCMKKQTKVE